MVDVEKLKELEAELKSAAISDEVVDAKLKALQGEVSVLKYSDTLSKVSVDVAKYQLNNGGAKMMAVTIRENLTEQEFVLSMRTVLEMSADLKRKLNPNGMLYDNDFNIIKSLVLLKAELCTDVVMVDSFPVLDEEDSCDSCDSYKALYDSLIEDFVSGAEYVTTAPDKFIDEDNGYVGLYCKDFNMVGRNVVLMSADALMRTLEICDKSEFISVMRWWRDNGLLWIRVTSKKTERMQVKHRIAGTDKYLWYAVVIPQNINLDTVDTVDTDIS